MAYQLRAADQYAQETWALPEAYDGRNEYLATILDFLVKSKTRFEFVLLPWKETSELHVSWNIFRCVDERAQKTQPLCGTSLTHLVTLPFCVAAGLIARSPITSLS